LLSINGLILQNLTTQILDTEHLRHHSLGVEECVERFGDYIVNSDNKKVPVKTIGEQHIIEDCGYIPSVSDWLSNLQPKRFMMDAKKLERKVA
jgi:hypothetical protein